MNIRATSSTPPAKPKQNSGSQENIKQLEQQKQAITKELEKVKSDDKIKPEVKEKKIEALQKKLKEIEGQIQKLKQNTDYTSETTKNTKSENVELGDNLKSVEITKHTEEISRFTSQSNFQKSKINEYAQGEEPTSAGTYKVCKDEEGNLKITFDDPAVKKEKGADAQTNSVEAEKNSISEEDSEDSKKTDEVADGEKITVVKTTVNTDAVDAEIEQLKQNRAKLEQKIASVEGDKDKQDKLKKQLQQLNSEIQTKDTDSYRRQNAIFTTV